MKTHVSLTKPPFVTIRYQQTMYVLQTIWIQSYENMFPWQKYPLSLLSTNSLKTVYNCHCQQPAVSHIKVCFHDWITLCHCKYWQSEVSHRKTCLHDQITFIPGCFTDIQGYFFSGTFRLNSGVFLFSMLSRKKKVWLVYFLYQGDYSGKQARFWDTSSLISKTTDVRWIKK